MDQKIIFRELLGEIREKAIAQGNRISRGEVEAFFAHAGLTGQQTDLICDYLSSERIHVEEDGEGTAGAARNPVEMYLKELENISLPDAPEEMELFRKTAAKDRDARDRLSRYYLQTVCSIAADYENEAISPEDLIQEGNVGLLMTLDTIEEMESLAAYRAALLNGIRQYLEKVILEHRAEQDAGSAAVRRVTRLDEARRKLTEELGRTVTVEEMSAYLDMPAEEIRSIAGLAGEEFEFDDLFPGNTDFGKKPWEI